MPGSAILANAVPWLRPGPIHFIYDRTTLPVPESLRLSYFRWFPKPLGPVPFIVVTFLLSQLQNSSYICGHRRPIPPAVANSPIDVFYIPPFGLRMVPEVSRKKYEPQCLIVVTALMVQDRSGKWAEYPTIGVHLAYCQPMTGTIVLNKAASPITGYKLCNKAVPRSLIHKAWQWISGFLPIIDCPCDLRSKRNIAFS